MIKLSLPKNGCRLMWNGFVSPYSSTGIDWMDGATMAVDHRPSERLRSLVEEYLSLWNMLHVEQPGVSAPAGRFRRYLLKRFHSFEYRIQSLGYDVSVVDDTPEYRCDLSGNVILCNCEDYPCCGH